MDTSPELEPAPAAIANRPPRISVNKLGEYLVSKPIRQRRILREQKFPYEPMMPYYQDAREAIVAFIAGSMQDIGILETRIKELDQSPANDLYENRRMIRNIGAIETFLDMLDDLDLQGGTPRPGDANASPLIVGNVEVGVAPEIVLIGSGKKSKKLVGGVKLHFPLTHPLTEDAAGYVSAVLQRYCRDRLREDGEPNAPYCMVIDVASKSVWPGVTSIKRRLKDVDAACEQIGALWPSIAQ